MQNESEIYKRYEEMVNRNAQKALESGYTEKQVKAIEYLTMAKNLMSYASDFDMFKASTPEYEYMGFVMEGFDKGVNKKLSEAELPEVSFPDISNIPNSRFYYDVLTVDDRREWEKKADEHNKKFPNKHHTGYSYWVLKSEEFREFSRTIRTVIDAMENYLHDFDEKAGTNYEQI